MDEKIIQIKKIIDSAIAGGIIKKLVLSKPADNERIKTSGKLLNIGGEVKLQLETFTKDGKARHLNIDTFEAGGVIASMIGGEYRQCDIITTGGDCSVMVSKGGKITILNRIKGGDSVAPESHNREKHHILSEKERYDFLIELGVEDANGRVIDRKRAKFRQINRFLELLEDVYDKLPKEGELLVADLCCGKSYLTFAVYYYLTERKGRHVKMYGVDLKGDVIEYCTGVASRLGYNGMEFHCGDIIEFSPERSCDLVISLHACDIATDIVLAKAVMMNAGVILSTPCCHHEMMGQLDSPELDFIARHSILKQKLCDAATDSLRALRLEAEGYDVTALELIDPEETPKNVMLRATKKKSMTGYAKEEKINEYKSACKLLGVKPKLDILLGNNGGMNHD